MLRRVPSGPGVLAPAGGRGGRGGGGEVEVALSGRTHRAHALITD